MCHTKLPDLGSGEVIELDRGTIRIRFASGERKFSLEHAGDYLEVTQEAPEPPPAKKKAARKSTKKKAAAKAESD